MNGAPSRLRGPGLLLLLFILLLTFAACSSAQASSTPTPSVPPTATSNVVRPTGSATPQPTLPSATPIIITDLNAFRSALANAINSNKWSAVAPLLSPQFSYQGTDSGGSQLLMPTSAHDFKQLYTSDGPWSQAAQYEVDIHYCFAGPTPKAQQIGFDSGSGAFILVGIQQWQNYWVAAWAIEDARGGGNGCATE